ncbi:MAG: 30S ribosomal protein S12 methylthiotransferase RimO [Actinomycetota bacterium]|nr:30S ribosomal protein S12 methylthiotransferase RimO [Actinomycetota bacterium]
MSNVAIVTLGCPKNAVDSENLGGLLASGGHDLVDDSSGADVVLVNTCGFIDPARRETVEDILELAELKDEGELRGLVVTGCLVARSAEELAEALPEVDALVDFAAYPRVAEIVSDVAAGRLAQRIQGDPGTRFDPAWWDASIASGPRIRFGRAPWSYIKIAEGCDRGCTFCAIPLMRGRLRSRGIDQIEAEARGLVASGVTELSLVSQDSVMWGRGRDDGDLIDLLKRLERIEGIRRLRLMYLHPQGVDDRLIEAMIGSDAITNYFDLSLQHVSPSVLKAMGRWGGRERFERMIEKIRSLDPLAAVRSTFILGFPGETDDDAAAVESFVAEHDLDWIGVFTYSREEGTRSYDMALQIPEPEARARAEAVTRAAHATMERRAAAVVGNDLEVLAERFDPVGRRWTGRSHREAPEVDGEIRFATSNGVSVGDYVSVRITDSVGADLEGIHRS